MDYLKVKSTINSEHTLQDHCGVDRELYVGQSGTVIGAEFGPDGAFIAILKMSDDTELRFHQDDLEQ